MKKLCRLLACRIFAYVVFRIMRSRYSARGTEVLVPILILQWGVPGPFATSR